MTDPAPDALALFDAVAAEPGSFCALAGRPRASTAPAAINGGRERTLAGARPFARLVVSEGQQARLVDVEGGIEKVLPGRNPLRALGEALTRFTRDGNVPTAGCALALAYDAAPSFLPVTLRERGGDPTGRPLLVASFYEAVLVSEPDGSGARPVATGFAHPDCDDPDARARQRCDELAAALSRERAPRPRDTAGTRPALASPSRC